MNLRMNTLTLPTPSHAGGENEIPSVAATILEVNWGFIALVSWIAGLVILLRTLLRKRYRAPRDIDTLSDDQPSFV